MIEQLKEKLSLTDDQVTQLKQLSKDQRKQEQAIRQDTTLSDDDRRTKLQALRKAQHDQVRALLTPDQQKIFDTMPIGGGRRRPRPDGAAGAPPPPADGAPPVNVPPPPS